LKHERIDIGTQFRDQKRDPVGHQPGDEMDIAAEPVEFGNRHGAAAPAGLREGSSEFGSAIEGVRALTGFHLDVLGYGIEPVRVGEMGEGLPLRFGAEPAPTLLRGGRSLGCCALWGGGVRGFAVTCIPVTDTVADEWLCCTALVGYSLAGTAAAWSMQVSRNRCATAG
jgi:hypothetical protein